MRNSINELYGNRLRVRACGICIMDEKLLLVNHNSLSENDFWAPPGGGISFEEKAETCISREFKEETGLTVEVGPFLFACEFIKPPLHAIELFFEVSAKSQTPVVGIDPEMDSKNQIIKEVRFMSGDEIKSMNPDTLHGLFGVASQPTEILRLRGYFKL